MRERLREAPPQSQLAKRGIDHPETLVFRGNQKMRPAHRLVGHGHGSPGDDQEDRLADLALESGGSDYRAARPNEGAALSRNTLLFLKII